MTTVILGATFPANPRTAIQAVETAQRFGSSVLQTVLFLIGKVEQRVKPTRVIPFLVTKLSSSSTPYCEKHLSLSLSYYTLLLQTVSPLQACNIYTWSTSIDSKNDLTLISLKLDFGITFLFFLFFIFKSTQLGSLNLAKTSLFRRSGGRCWRGQSSSVHWVHLRKVSTGCIESWSSRPWICLFTDKGGEEAAQLHAPFGFASLRIALLGYRTCISWERYMSYFGTHRA